MRYKAVARQFNKMATMFSKDFPEIKPVAEQLAWCAMTLIDAAYRSMSTSDAYQGSFAANTFVSMCRSQGLEHLRGAERQLFVIEVVDAMNPEGRYDLFWSNRSDARIYAQHADKYDALVGDNAKTFHIEVERLWSVFRNGELKRIGQISGN